jgi:6-phosphofructokinase 1
MQSSAPSSDGPRTIASRSWGFVTGGRVVRGSDVSAHPGEHAGILHRGGTILGTSRVNPLTVEEGRRRPSRTRSSTAYDAVVAIGGGNAVRRGQAVRTRAQGGRIPKTIDNDLKRDGLHLRVRHRGLHRHRGDRSPTQHGRVSQAGLVVEVMGRHVGWIATHSGIRRRGGRDPRSRGAGGPGGGGGHLKRRYAGGTSFSIVVVA